MSLLSLMRSRKYQRQEEAFPGQKLSLSGPRSISCLECSVATCTVAEELAGSYLGFIHPDQLKLPLQR